MRKPTKKQSHPAYKLDGVQTGLLFVAGLCFIGAAMQHLGFNLRGFLHF